MSITGSRIIPTPKTPATPAHATAAAMPADTLDGIMRYAFDENAAAVITAVPTMEPAAPAYVPPDTTLAAGERMFSDVFGWKPETLPRDIPVRVFDACDWPENMRQFIPSGLPEGDLWTWPRAATELLALAMYAGDRALVHGPTGSGKSALVLAWAHMCNIPLIRVNCHGEQQSTDFLGKDIIAVDPASGSSILRYDWSLTTLAARWGGLLLLDEAFRSPVLMSVQSLLERNGTLTLPDAASLTPDERRIVPPAGKFWIVLTDNTNGTGDESGSYNAEVQDLSTLGRITATLEVPYMQPDAQLDQLKRAAPDVPATTLADLAQWAHKMREAFLTRAVMQPICLRVLLSVISKYRVIGDLKIAIGLAYLAKLGSADRLVACEAYRQVTGEDLQS